MINHTTVLLLVLALVPFIVLEGPIFAANSCWQAKLPDNAPINANTSSYIKNIIGQITQFGPWINTLSFSVPIYVVPENQPTVYVKLNKPGGAPIVDQLQAAWNAVPLPSNAHPANGSDHHLVVLQPSTGKMWEFWAMSQDNNSVWSADWGGFLENYPSSTGFFGEPFPTWGATATSLMLPGGLMLVSEAKAGVFPHALAFAILNMAPWNEVVLPAQRSDGNGQGVVPEGTRFRLPANVDLTNVTNSYAKMMAIAIRDYGLIIRDTAGVPVTYAEDPTPYGIPNPWPTFFDNQWENHIMQQLPWEQMEVVDPSWQPWNPASPCADGYRLIV